jgi:hypothetical protein
MIRVLSPGLHLTTPFRARRLGLESLSPYVFPVNANLAMPKIRTFRISASHSREEIIQFAVLTFGPLIASFESDDFEDR